MPVKGKGSKMQHKIVRCSATDKIQRIKEFKTLLIEWGVTGFEYKFSRNDFIEEIRKRDAQERSKFINQDSTTLSKWINLAIGLVPREMEEVQELMISYTGLGKGRGLVWEVLEKGTFGRLNAEKKILCLRAMASKHVYRIKLASKVKRVLKAGTDDDSIPPHSGDGDLHTKWIGSESQELIHHCDYIGCEVRKFTSGKDIPDDILTKGHLCFSGWETNNGISGILSHLYEDVPGPKSNRTPKHDPSTHLQKIISSLMAAFPCVKDLDDYTTDSVMIASERADSIQRNVEKPSGEAQSLLNESSSAFIPEKASEEQPRQQKCKTQGTKSSLKVKKKVSPQHRSKRNRSTTVNEGRALKRRKSERHATINTVDDDQIRNDTVALQPNLDKNGDIYRRFSRLSPRYPVNLEGKQPRNPIPRTPPSSPPRTPSLSPSLGSVSSRLNGSRVIRSPTVTPEEESSSVEEDILASGHASHAQPNYSIKFTENVGSQRKGVRRLVDLDDEESASESEAQKAELDERAVFDNFFYNHEHRVREMIGSGDCIAYKMRRTDDYVTVEDMVEEIFPPAISPDSFARKISVRQARLVQGLIDQYTVSRLHMIAKHMKPNEYAVLSATSVEYRLASRVFFNGLKYQLEDKGFLLLEGILHPSLLGENNNIQYLFDYVNINFQQYPVLMNSKKEMQREKKKLALWGSIYNEGEGEVEHKKPLEERRFMTLGHKLMNIQEENWKRKKAAVDIQLGNIISRMYLPEEETNRGKRHFAFPDYGSIYLRTCKATPAQTSHCDFPPVDPGDILPRNVPPPLLDLFMMYSAEQPFAIRVWQGSHVSLNLGNVADDIYSSIARNIPSKLVLVPPFSVLIGRGDLLHAGASGEELKVAFTSYGGTTKVQREMAANVFRRSGDFSCNTRGHITATRGNHFFDSLFRTPSTTPTRIIDSNMPRSDQD